MRIAKRFGALALLLCVGLAGPMGSARAADEGKDAMDRVGLQPTGPGTFSIDVSDADIRTIARAISEFSGRNIIVAKDVKATVSAKLTNVGWREALRTMLYSANLDYDEDGSILRVDERTKMLTERADRLAAIAKQMENAALETRIIKLNYASAPELQASLVAGLTRRGSILVEKRTNSLIVSDLASNLDSVEKMAIALDSTTPQIEITAKLVDVDVEALRDLGVTWNVGGATTSGLVEGPAAHR
jgi:type II secretory pathway component HofQ